MFKYGEKCCCCINLKTGCYFIALILLVFQSFVVNMAIKLFVDFITLTKVFYVDVNDPYLFSKYLAYLLFGMMNLAIAITVIAFTIILIKGLYKENRNYIGWYLIFGTIMLLVFVLLCVIESSFNIYDLQDISVRSIFILLNVYFIYKIKCYWTSIYPHNEKEYVVKV